MSFKSGDRVYLPTFDGYEGVIREVYPEECAACVEVEMHNGSCCFPFAFEEMQLITKERIPTMEIFKSVHGTVHVVVQNCSAYVNDFLSLFDVWKSGGNYKYDEVESWERAKIWFECPMEFMDFIESDMGRIALRRLGIEKIEVRH